MRKRHNARVQARRRVSADVAWNPLLGMRAIALITHAWCCYTDRMGKKPPKRMAVFPPLGCAHQR